MHNRKNAKQRLMVAALLSALVCVFALGGCKNFFHPDGPSDDKPTGSKTLVQFNNLEVFPVTVYSNSSMTAKIADVGANRTATVETTPAPNGTAFYPRYHLRVEGIQIPPYDGEAIIARIDGNRTNPVAIPPLEAIEAGDAFIKLENANAAYSLTMKKGGVEMFPIGKGSSIIMQNETASYSVPPGASSGYSLIRNPSTAVAFPAGLTTFSPGYVYLLRYNGTALVLTEAAKPVFLRHMIRYDANGGSGPTPVQQAVTQGSSVATAGQGNLSRIGHTFSGWNTAADGSGASYAAGSSITPTANIMLYAKWAPIPYTVSYNANGGSGSAPAPQSAGYGSSFAISGQGGLSFAARLFDGWNTNANGSGTSYPAGSSTTVNANLALYAQWIDPATIRYTVTYNANYGGGSAPSPQMATNGTTIAVSNPGALSYAGKGFIGWNTNPSGGGIAYAAGSSLTVSGNITLYAQWIAQYTVSYNVNGGSGTVPALQTVNSGSGVTVADKGSLSRAGCTFNGWNTNSAGTGTAYPAGSSLTVSGNITLYAHWTVRVTYNANGGSGTAPAAQTVNPGVNVTVSNAGSLSKSGYAFIGWNSSSSGLGTNYAVGASLPVNENVTLYAKWGIPENLSLAASLAWIASNAVDGGVYTITVKANEAIAPTTLSYGGKNVSITLKGDTSVRTISLSAKGALFTVSNRVTLTLDNNVTLQGRSDNTVALVSVSGTLVMNNGSKITGNTASGSSNNVYGGGVCVSLDGMFTMSGGEISGNTASNSGNAYGGGVYVSGGTFTMSGGEISGNTATSITSRAYGGGVYVNYGTFTKTGGTIFGSDTPTVLKNTVSGYMVRGPAVYLDYLSKRRNTTAGTGVNLDSRVDGPAGGWE